MTFRNNFFGGLLVGLIIGAAAGAGAMWILNPSTQAPGSVTLTTAGSTTLYPLSEIWSEEYTNVYPNTTVQVAGGGSGYGQTAVGAGEIDIGASSSSIKSENLVTYPGLKQIPVALDGLAIVMNAAINGTGMQKLTREAVIAIFQGNVTTWENLESQFGVVINATGDIHVYARSDASGTTDTFSRWRKTNATAWKLGAGETVSWPGSVTSLNGNPTVATAVSVDALGIGYVGLAFANETTTPTLKQVALQNPTTGEYVLPSYDSVKLAVPSIVTDASMSLFNANISGAYPIARMLYYILHNETVKYQSIKYIRWALGDGQSFVRSVGYIEVEGTAITAFSLGLLDELEAIAA